LIRSSGCSVHVDSTRSCHTLSLKLYRAVKNVTRLRSVTSYFHIVLHQPYVSLEKVVLKDIDGNYFHNGHGQIIHYLCARNRFVQKLLQSRKNSMDSTKVPNIPYDSIVPSRGSLLEILIQEQQQEHEQQKMELLISLMDDNDSNTNQSFLDQVVPHVLDHVCYIFVNHSYPIIYQILQ
jgi:hypothetical protein